MVAADIRARPASAALNGPVSPHNVSAPPSPVPIEVALVAVVVWCLLVATALVTVQRSEKPRPRH